MRHWMLLGTLIVAAGAFAAGPARAQSQSQSQPSDTESLGDLARKLKQERAQEKTKPTKTISNDDLGSSSSSSEATESGRAYSYTEYTEDPVLRMNQMTVKVSRDGSKLAWEQFNPPGAGRAKEFHVITLYDLHAQKVYTKILSEASAPCSVMNYTSSIVPPGFDLISDPSGSIEEITGAKGQGNQVGTETVDGIATKIMEMTSSAGKDKVWVAQDGGFPVKIVSVGPGGKSKTVMEMKQINFAKPPASAFAPPAGCPAIGGEMTAHGVHAEIGYDLSTSKSGANGGARALKSGPQPTPNVTAVTLQDIPSYTGPCPAHIKFVGTITTDGPGRVFYEFGDGTNALNPGQSITFSAAGTKTVTYVMALPTPGNQNFRSSGAVLRAIGEDSSGNHGMPTLNQLATSANFRITCTRGGRE